MQEISLLFKLFPKLKEILIRFKTQMNNSHNKTDHFSCQKRNENVCMIGHEKANISSVLKMPHYPACRKF